MPTTSRTGRLLHRVVRASTVRPTLTVLLCLLAAVAGIGYTVRAITFETDTLRLLPANQRYAVRFEEYRQDFGALNETVVAIEAPTPREARAYAGRLASELRHSSERAPRISYRIDPARFRGRQLLLMPLDKLEQLRDRIFDSQDMMEHYSAQPTLVELLNGINRQIAGGFLTHFFDLGLGENRPRDLRFLRELLGQMSAELDGQEPGQAPWSTAFGFKEADEADAGYFFSPDDRLLFVLVESVRERGSFSENRELIATIRGAIASLRADYPNVRAGVTGTPALSTDEMHTAFKDSQVATLLAFALTLGLLLLLFRRVLKPFLMVGVLVLSLGWSLGIITATIGHLSVFSVMFISLMVGIGIDYGIYFLFRYEEEVGLGWALRPALERTTVYAGPGILMGALTAAGTFAMLGFTEFRGVSEFGVISGIAIFMAFAAMITLFPALVVLVDSRGGHLAHDAISPPPDPDALHVPLLESALRHPRTILAAAAVLTLVCLWLAPRVTFDYNMLNLQSQQTESVVWEKRIFAAGSSGLTGLATAGSLDELQRKQEAFERLPTVARVDSVLRVVPPDQSDKTDAIRDFAPLLSSLEIGHPPALDPARLREALDTLKRRLDFAQAEAGPGGPGEEIESARRALYGVLERLGRVDPEKIRSRLGRLQTQIRQDFVKALDRLKKNLHPRPLALEDVPEELNHRFVGKSQRLLMRIHPEVDAWDRKSGAEFLAELRSVDPDVTGPPVIRHEAIRLMEKAYFQGTIYAFILVATVAVAMLRRWLDAAIAMLPLVLGLIWTMGLMHVFGLQFNLANVFGLPLIVGAAAEYGLNVVLRWRESRRHGGPVMARSTVLAVTLNGLTTIAGFGSLMVAGHRGIWSLGLLLTIGTTVSLIASLVVLPVVIRLVTRAPALKPSPATPAAG